MDRDRLKDIQTAELSESNINEDFVHWLKTKGPSYLLVVMVVIVGYLFYVRYQTNQSQRHGEAWVAFAQAKVSGLPASFEDIATSYSDIDSLRPLGLLSAADGYLKAVLLGQTLSSNANVTTALTQEERTFYLQKADALYAEVVADDNNTDASTLFAVSGLSGRAAVAESTGNIDTARTFYEAIIVRSADQYPSLAKQAQLRIDTLGALASAISLPTEKEISARNNQVLRRDTKAVDSDINSLILPR